MTRRYGRSDARRDFKTAASRAVDSQWRHAEAQKQERRRKLYEGVDYGQDGVTVTIVETGERYVLPHIERHSPDGFAWGYGGSGPSDLALSILHDLVGPELADEHYQAFKREVVAHFPQRSRWNLGEPAIRAWLAFHGDLSDAADAALSEEACP